MPTPPSANEVVPRKTRKTVLLKIIDQIKVLYYFDNVEYYFLLVIIHIINQRGRIEP